MSNYDRNTRSVSRSKKGWIPWLRRGIQVLCFLLVPSLFIQIWNSLKEVFMLILHGEGTLSTIAPDLVLLITATAVTALAGRFFCGWMCSFGAMQDLLYRLPRLGKKHSRRSVSERTDDILKVVKYSLLIAIVVFVWGLQLVTIPSGTSPWDFFGMISVFWNMPALSVLFPAFIPAAILLAAIVAGSFFIERFFCRYLCPLGAYFSLISRARLFYVSKPRENCGRCSLCSVKCSVGIPLGETNRVKDGECIDCMECVRYCPSANAELAVDERERNALAAGAVSCVLIAGSSYLGNFVSMQANAGTGSYMASAASEDTTSASETDTTAATSADVIVSGQAASSADSADVSSENTTAEAASEDTTTAATAAAASDETQAVASTSSGVASQIADGTYTGTGTGLRGTTTVQVTVAGGQITDISVVSYEDDQQFFSRASSTVIDEILQQQDVSVDAVSGATYSSNGIMEAVADALNVSYTPATVSQQGGPGMH
ncbi:MAG: 4Fe-4S binding protein [Lachnospiraceae bacterium]|jgi:polyferredoxin/uncharacterized protein with FMN-binding domain|nr:4Fe-4S binding protein [Lachnospiraceae bacterium]